MADSILVFDGPCPANNRNWAVRLGNDRRGDYVELQEGDGPWELLGDLDKIHRFGLPGSAIPLMCAGAWPQMMKGVLPTDAETRARLVRFAFRSDVGGTGSQRLPAACWESLGLLARYHSINRSALIERLASAEISRVSAEIESRAVSISCDT